MLPNPQGVHTGVAPTAIQPEAERLSSAVHSTPQLDRHYFINDQKIHITKTSAKKGSSRRNRHGQHTFQKDKISSLVLKAIVAVVLTLLRYHSWSSKRYVLVRMFEV